MGKEKLTELLEYFYPVNSLCTADKSILDDPSSFGSSLAINKGSGNTFRGQRFDIALIGVWGNTTIQGASPDYSAADSIRLQLYRLKQVAPSVRIADFGNLKEGKDQRDSLYALQEVCTLLFSLKINVIILGGIQQFTVGQMGAYKEYENDINLALIDSKIPLGDYGSQSIPEYFLLELIEKEASSLYNISVIGYQSYFTDMKQVETFEKNHFELYRLGMVRNHPEEIEAVLRDADLVSFDISALRSCDAPGQLSPSPNGLYAEEACTLARYAGIGDRCRSFALYGLQPGFDMRNQSSMALAQIIWYYIEGFHQRKNDFPIAKLDDYLKYSVAIDEIDFPIVFYKSEKSQRWWLEVSNMEKNEEKFTKIVVACSEADYQKACRNEIPERWWTNFKKLR